MSKQDKSKQPLTNALGENGCLGNKPLRDVVKEALLSLLTDPLAPAAAKASAGRTLLDYFDGDHEHAHGNSGKRTSELTLAELDAELAK